MPSRQSVSGPDFQVLYRGLRVDHLSPGELDYELFLRNVVIGDDESRCKRRRRLKQILKDEREGHEFIIHYDQDPEMDLEACKHMFKEFERKLTQAPSAHAKIPYQARLLHLGHRLAVVKNHAIGELKVQAAEAFRGVLDLFSEHFWSDDVFFAQSEPDSENESELLDEAVGGTGVADTARSDRYTGAIPKQPKQSNYVTVEQFNQAMTDIGCLIKALSTQISGLKEDVKKSSAPPPVPKLNSTNPFFEPTEVPEVNPTAPRVNWADFESGTRLPKPPHKQSTGLPESTLVGTEALNSSFIRRLDDLSFTSSVGGNGPSQAEPMSVGPNVRYIPQPYPVPQPRKTTPVSQWKIKKYSGNDQGLGLNDFLSHVHQLAISEHASADDLFDSAIHLFDGAALSWYTAGRSRNLLQGWDHLIQELRNEFRHPDLDSVLRTKIYQTRQQKGESFQQYYLQIEKLFQAMHQCMSDTEKVEVLKTNMRYDCRKALVGRNIRTLKDLLNIGKELDATDFSAFSKVFGPPKRESCAINSSSGGGSSGSKTFYSRNKPSEVGNASNQQGKSFKNNTNPPKGTFFRSSHQKVDQKPPEKGSKFLPPPKESPPGPSQPSALLKMVSNYSPPDEGECFNCGEEHDLSDCPIPRRVFCEACAFKGFTRKNCPYCLKNQMRKS